MYKLWHVLFGWDYVQPTKYNFRRRVRRLPTGEVYFVYSGTIYVIEKYTDVYWLTCIPEKWGLSSEL